VTDVETLAALDAAIARGLADAEAGPTKPLEQVLERLEARYRAWADEAHEGTAR
jgi:antitoxin ParD1/3/4